MAVYVEDAGHTSFDAFPENLACCQFPVCVNIIAV
jgi:hypothetical protein